MIFGSLRRSRAWPMVAALLLGSPLPAQVAPPAPPPADTLDPGSPLAPLPDLGVDWPDLSAPESAGEGETRGAIADAGAEQRYHVVLAGVDGVGDDRLQTRFDELSVLVQGQGKTANIAQIDRRAREDEGVLRDLLRSYGYYDADVVTVVTTDTGTGRILVTLRAEPGPVYRFDKVETGGLDAGGAAAAGLRSAFPVAPGQAVDAEKVQAAEGTLKTALGHQGFAFAQVDEPEVVVDHDTRTATLTLPVATGAAQRFGAIEVDGTRLFSAKHLGRIARFAPGDPYDAALVEDYRRALIQTGLVSTVKLTQQPGATPGTVDIATRLEPAPPRTIAGELGYGTGEGALATVSWTHRNLIQPEGAVTFSGALGTKEQQLGATLRRSNYKARDRVLSAQIVASHTQRDAYDARTFTVAGALERQSNIIWQKTWTWSVGGEMSLSDERDTIGPLATPRRRTFKVIAAPASLAYDGTDDLLNPTRGYRLAGRLSPELSFQGGTFTYARAQIDASAYLPVSGRITIAGRTRLGTIVGAQRDQIAPSRRFYAGGGGSIRGYGYQDVGPVDANNDPIGGRSLTEFSLEARVRVGDFGVVPFVDAGNLYTSPLPRFSGFRYGTGLGARYYTSFGPIRIDVGTPIARRHGEPRVTVYVSLGQAF